MKFKRNVETHHAQMQHLIWKLENKQDKIAVKMYMTEQR